MARLRKNPKASPANARSYAKAVNSLRSRVPKTPTSPPETGPGKSGYFTPRAATCSGKS
jgi:hypothetical protein